MKRNVFGSNQQQKLTVASFGQTLPITSGQSILLFGNNSTENQSNSSLFGTNTQPSLFTNTQQYPNGGGVFGNQSQATIIKPTSFGEQSNTSSIFKSTPTPSVPSSAFKINRDHGLFPKQNIGHNFGNQQSTAAGSSIAKYQPTTDADPAPVKQNCICFMKEYENKNFEEIRFEDFNSAQTNYPFTTKHSTFGGQHTNSFGNQFNNSTPKFTFGVPPDAPVYQLPNPPQFPNYVFGLPNYAYAPPPFGCWPNHRQQQSPPPPKQPLFSGFKLTQESNVKKPTVSNFQNHPPLCGGYIFPDKIKQQPPTTFIQPNTNGFNYNFELAPKPKVADVINPATGQPYTYGTPFKPVQHITETNNGNIEETITNDNKDSKSSDENTDNNSSAKPPPPQQPPTPGILLCIAIHNLTINMNTK